MAGLKMLCSGNSFLVEAHSPLGYTANYLKSERVYETAPEVLAPFRRAAELLFPDRGRRFHS